MSFSTRLHDNIGLANQYVTQGKKAIEEMIQFLKLITQAEENYAKSLESICNFQFLLVKGSMLEAGHAIKHDLSNKVTQIRAFIDNITQDIIKTFQTIASVPLEQAKLLTMNSSKILKIKENYFEKLSKHKEKFWKSCQECEKITFNLEQPQSQILREKFLQKLIKHKNSLDGNLKSYQDHVDSWSDFEKYYSPLIVPVMDSYEKNEFQRLESIKDQLRKYVVYETSYIRNLQYEIDVLAKSMEELDIEKDLLGLCPVSPPIVKPEFENYKGTHSAYKNLGVSGLLFAIPLPIQEPKWSEIVFQGSIEEMYKTEVDIISLKATQGYDLSSEDFVQFNSLIKDSLGRKAWVWSMNQKKIDSLLSDKGFLQLGELMLSVLNEVISI